MLRGRGFGHPSVPVPQLTFVRSAFFFEVLHVFIIQNCLPAKRFAPCGALPFARFVCVVLEPCGYSLEMMLEELLHACVLG